jgi:hypothetical protein
VKSLTKFLVVVVQTIFFIPSGMNRSVEQETPRPYSRLPQSLSRTCFGISALFSMGCIPYGMQVCVLSHFSTERCKPTACKFVVFHTINKINKKLTADQENSLTLILLKHASNTWAADCAIPPIAPEEKHPRNSTLRPRSRLFSAVKNIKM